MTDVFGVMLKIRLERKRQDEKWGEQNHPDNIWYLILAEEMGELAKALLPEASGKDGNAHKELIEVAAVAVAWLEAIDRRSASIELGKAHDEGYPHD
jgi:NTP pyrophosphatase (non-canonical NTP hydrolase)